MNSDILDRPIAFHRSFVTITGSVNAALMLSQAVYWQRRNEECGWWFQTRAKWEDETGLSREEQETARKKLRQLEFWKEELRGVPAKLYYYVDLEELMDQLNSLPTSKRDSRQLVRGIPANKEGAIPPTTNKEKRLKEETKEETTQPSARVNFVARWCESFEKQFGFKYKVSGPDLGAIKTERLGTSEESTVEKLINDAVKIWNRPGWLSKRCVTIQGFLASQNQVRVELMTPLKGEQKEMKDPAFKIKIAQF